MASHQKDQVKESRRRGGRIRRHQVENEDGWTVITHGMSRITVNGRHTKDQRKSHKVDPVSNGLPNRVIDGLNTTKLHETFHQMQEQYKDTAVAKQIAEILATTRYNICEAVCIGIGSFSRDWEHRYRSLWQLVLFIDVARQLNNNNNSKLKLYAQDPAFTALDLSFLKLLEITATSDSIQNHISTTTFVFSPFVDWFLLLPTFLKDKDPILYVGNEVLDDYSAFAKSEEKKEQLTACDEIGKMFLHGRECTKLQDFEKHAHAFNGMVIYTRKEEETADDER